MANPNTPTPLAPKTQQDPLAWLAVWFAATNVGGTFLVGSADWISEVDHGWLIWVLGGTLVTCSAFGLVSSIFKISKKRAETETRKKIELQLLEAEVEFAKYDSQLIVNEVSGSLPNLEHFLKVAVDYNDELRAAALQSQISEANAKLERAKKVIEYWERKGLLLSTMNATSE